MVELDLVQEEAQAAVLHPLVAQLVVPAAVGLVLLPVAMEVPHGRLPVHHTAWVQARRGRRDQRMGSRRGQHPASALASVAHGPPSLVALEVLPVAALRPHTGLTLGQA